MAFEQSQCTFSACFIACGVVMLFSTYPTLKCVHAASDDSQCILLTESVAYGNTIGLGV